MSVPYYGDIAEDKTIYIPFNTFTSDDPSASSTITNLINTDIHIHKGSGAGSSTMNTTQRNNAAGITVDTDFDGITGNHLVTIDTSDNTVAGFYEVGYEYAVRMEGTTVDGATINAWIGLFSIERSGGVIEMLTNATYGLSAIEALVDDLESRLTATRAGYLDELGPTNIPADVDAILTDTGTTLPGTLTTIEGKVDTVDGIVDSILVDTGTTLQAELDGIQADTEDLQTQIGTAGAGLTAVPWNASWDAEVQSECADALNAYDPPTKAELDIGIAGLNDLSAAQVNSEVDTALSDIHLDHLLAADYDPASKPGVATALLNELVENDSGVSRFTENALEQAPSGTGASAATIADAVWDEAQADHVGAGTFGVVASEIADVLVDTGTTIPGTITSLQSDVTAVLADTNELQGDWADGGRLDLIQDAILDDTDLIDDGTSGLAKIATDVAAVLVDTGTTIPGTITTMQGNVTDILADTNELQADDTPTAISGLDTKIDTIDNFLDTEIAAILEDTGTTLPATLATILADTAELQGDWVDGGRLDLLLDGVKSVTDAITAAAAAKLALSAGTIVVGTVSHDNSAATTTVFYSDDITEATADHYNGRIVIFTSGALQNQATDITDYQLVSGEGEFTVTALTEAPADNSTFVIV